MDDAPDRTLSKLRIDAKLLADLVEIMSRNGRRAVVKLDDHRVDDLSSLAPAEITSASEVDISSFWLNPDRPLHGRRHFVYFLSGPTGAQYFGDSISPEVVKVCQDLDAYFGRQGLESASAGKAAAVPTWWPSGWLFETQERLISALALAGTLLMLFGFLIGRWTAPDSTIHTTSPMTEFSPDPSATNPVPSMSEPTSPQQ